MVHADFVHLHVHTQYSLLDGACLLEKLVDKALSLSAKGLGYYDGKQNAEEWMGSLDETQMQELIVQFPDFLSTNEFEAIPNEFKERILSGFMQPEGAEG